MRLFAWALDNQSLAPMVLALFILEINDKVTHLEGPFCLSISFNLTLTLNLFQKSAPLALIPFLSALGLFLCLGENGVISSSSPSLKNAFFFAKRSNPLMDSDVDEARGWARICLGVEGKEEGGGDMEMGAARKEKGRGSNALEGERQRAGRSEMLGLGEG